jgi:hypothetical protein
MRTVPLYGKVAAGRVALVDDADYELVMQYRWNVQERQRPNGQRAIGPYAFTSVPDNDSRIRIVFMHSLLMPGVAQVDHEDTNGLNNQRSNLRPATGTQNQGNRRKGRLYGGRATSSRWKGVGWFKPAGRWRACITQHGRQKHLGYFADEDDAARAYDAAAREFFGEFARLNFPDDQPVTGDTRRPSP